MTDLPPLQPLSPAALLIRRIRVAIVTLAALIVVTALLVVLKTISPLDVPVWIGPPVVLLFAAVAWWWAGVDYRRWGWRLTPDLFEVRHGVLVHHTYLVPRSRIQNVTTTGGPLQRTYGLLTLRVHTAGARTKSVSIEDLDVEAAAAIRRRLDLI